MIVRALWLAGALLAVAGAISSAEAEPSADAAFQTVDAFHRALERGNAAEAALLLDDDAVVYEVGEAETSKAQYLAAHLPADIAFLREVRETTVARTGHASADLAWVATQGRMSGRHKDKAVDRATTETMVLRQTPKGWSIVHIHWSSRSGGP